jgi:hypothetical protein
VGSMSDLHHDEPLGGDASGEPVSKSVEPGSSERPVDRFCHSATGAVIAAGLLGLRDALEGRPDKVEIAVVSDAPDPTPSSDLEVIVDFEHPERSVAIIRRSPADEELIHEALNRLQT